MMEQQAIDVIIICLTGGLGLLIAAAIDEFKG